MKTRHVDVATSPHTHASAPNIFFSILLLPEKSNLKEFKRKYEKEGDFYFIQGNKNQGRRSKSRETLRSQSRSDCSLCSFERCQSGCQSELYLQTIPSSRPFIPSSNSSRMSNNKTDRLNYEDLINPGRGTTEIECIECNNNNCNSTKNYEMAQEKIVEVVEGNEGDIRMEERMRKNSELIREELLMRDSLRKELIRSLSSEPRYEGCFKKSIPCLITPAAVIFCLLNFFIPGSGTLFCSLSILLFRCETGYGSHRWKRAFCVSLIAALIQSLTCLIVIGWVWSIMWGVDLVMMSSNYECDKGNDDLFEEEIRTRQLDINETLPKETIVIGEIGKERRRIQFLDTYLARNRQMEQII